MNKLGVSAIALAMATTLAGAAHADPRPISNS